MVNSLSQIETLFIKNTSNGALLIMWVVNMVVHKIMKYTGGHLHNIYFAVRHIIIINNYTKSENVVHKIVMKGNANLPYHW